MAADLPIILLPGIGTDARLFALQRMAFPQLIVPDWLPPLPRESLPEYAARLAASVRVTQPCLVGGMSLGGMIALEMTRHLPAVGCVLIASVKSRHELPLLLRGLGPIAWVLPQGSDRLIAAFGGLLKQTVGRVLPRRGRQLCDHLSKLRTPMVPWAWRAGLSWRPQGDWPCPVFHLHGERDAIFPPRWTTPNQLVPHAGHLLPVTHPFAVNEFLRGCVARLVEEGADSPRGAAHRTEDARYGRPQL